jgi:hypothetical protein
MLGCGGGSSNTPDEDPPLDMGGGGGDAEVLDKDAMCEAGMDAAIDTFNEMWTAIEDKGAPETLEDLAAAACTVYCGRATECAIEDGCEKSEDEVREMQLAKTAPENTRQCVDKCNTWRLTKEQIQSLGQCSQDEESSCADFLTCTDAAKP